MKKHNVQKNLIMYKTEAITCMAEMFDYAENVLKISSKEFFALFNKTSISDLFFNLDVRLVLGKSSIEIVKEVLYINKVSYKEIRHRNNSYIAYWVGLIVASYCYTKNISFKKFELLIDIDEIKRKYNPLHEAPHSKAIEAIDKILKLKETNLARYREMAGYSQSELATISGVSLRSIQMYEQRNKDINKASFSTIRNLSKSLNIENDDLYECTNVENDGLIIMY